MAELIRPGVEVIQQFRIPLRPSYGPRSFRASSVPRSRWLTSLNTDATINSKAKVRRVQPDWEHDYPEFVP